MTSHCEFCPENPAYKLFDNYLFKPPCSGIFFYPNHYKQLEFTNFSQNRSPYKTSHCEFCPENPATHDLDPKPAYKLFDYYLFKPLCSGIFFYPNHYKQLAFTNFSQN